MLDETRTQRTHTEFTNSKLYVEFMSYDVFIGIWKTTLWDDTAIAFIHFTPAAFRHSTFRFRGTCSVCVSAREYVISFVYLQFSYCIAETIQIMLARYPLCSHVRRCIYEQRHSIEHEQQTNS